MEILKENYGLYKVLECTIKKVLKKTKKWVEHDIWQFLEQFGHLVALSNDMLFIIMKS